MVASHLGHFRKPKHATVLLTEEKSEVATTLFTDSDKTQVDCLARFVGPSAAGDNIGCDHCGRRSGLEELAT